MGAEPSPDSSALRRAQATDERAASTWVTDGAFRGGRQGAAAGVREEVQDPRPAIHPRGLKGLNVLNGPTDPGPRLGLLEEEPDLAG